MLVADEISEVADKLPLNLGDDVDESDCTSVEGCRSPEGFPATLNGFDAVSAGCTTVAPVLVGVISLPASEVSGPASVIKVVGRVADISRPWLDALVVGRSVAGLLLDTTLGVNDVAVGAVEEVVEGKETSELAAMEGINDKEDVGIVIEVWLSARNEISVLLRNRAAYWCLGFCQRKAWSTAQGCLYLLRASTVISENSSHRNIRTYCQQYYYSEPHSGDQRK